MKTASFEVNTKSRSFSGTAAAVARVAAEWAKNGLQPTAYAIFDDGDTGIRTVAVEVTTASKTKAALLAAK